MHSPRFHEKYMTGSHLNFTLQPTCRSIWTSDSHQLVNGFVISKCFQYLCFFDIKSYPSSVSISTSSIIPITNIVSQADVWWASNTGQVNLSLPRFEMRRDPEKAMTPRLRIQFIGICPKFNRKSPLKSYRIPIGKACLPTSNHHFSGASC